MKIATLEKGTMVDDFVSYDPILHQKLLAITFLYQISNGHAFSNLTCYVSPLFSLITKNTVHFVFQI